MYYYWHGGDVGKNEKHLFKGLTLRGDYDAVARALEEASTLDPYDLDVKFSLASTYLLQKKRPEALRTYRHILNLAPDNFEANLLYGTYSKLNGDNHTYTKIMARLERLYPERTRMYREKFAALEQGLKEPVSISVPAIPPAHDHVIVVLGYALMEDGSLSSPLIGRLETALAMANYNPQARILVSGVEAGPMRSWLMDHGISPERITMEKASHDTLENALFSLPLLLEERVKSVTLVTSASHVRRALMLFREAAAFYARMNGIPETIRFTHAAYLDYPSLEEANRISLEERWVLYRDLFRVSGIWQYPGLQM